VPTQKVVSLGVHPRRSRTGFRLRYVVLAGFLCWGAYVYFYVQMPILRTQAGEQKTLGLQISQADHQVTVLNRHIVALHTYKYIASLAEQKYHLIAPGEVLFTTASSSGS